MNLAIASGKGGTGKTTVATNLAWVAASLGRDVTYLDCDVEEPNGGIFLQPEIASQQPVQAAMPNVDHSRCNACGQCGEVCQFSAIVPMGKNVLTFPELCHGCGGCWEVCPTGAVQETSRKIGRLEIGRAGGVRWIEGVLNIGEAMSPPVIRAVKGASPRAELVIVDCPPGTSCPVIEALRGNDFVLLVTEPTPFGLNDLKLAVETCRTMQLPFGVVVNRAGTGDDATEAYCREEGINILAEIPDSRNVAEAYSRGQLAAQMSPQEQGRYAGLLDAVCKEARA